MSERTSLLTLKDHVRTYIFINLERPNENLYKTTKIGTGTRSKKFKQF